MKQQLYKYLIEHNQKRWNYYINHPFGTLLINDTMPMKMFKEYLSQDNTYLDDYIHAFILLAAKARNQKQKKYALSTAISTIESEQEFQEFLTLFNLENNKRASLATLSYTSYFYMIAYKYDYLSLLICLSVCGIGYYEFANNLDTSKAKNQDSLYVKWIKFYQNTEIKKFCIETINLINSFDINELSPKKLQRLNIIFSNVIELEINFFNQSL